MATEDTERLKRESLYRTLGIEPDLINEPSTPKTAKMSTGTARRNGARVPALIIATSEKTYIQDVATGKVTRKRTV